VQRFAQFNEKGQSMAKEWQSIIDDATKRIGGVNDSRCRVTVTDKFGGRGHDFQVVDKEANANGGMLVIATSIPDEREWIQWKGRTARQDRPGQFYVILDETAKPFSEPSRKKLKDELRKLSSAKGKGGESPDDQKIELMLEVADEGIDAKLKAFEMEQAQGEKLNELTEKYYAAHPRLFSDPWPFPEFKKTDAVLRRFLADWEQLKLTPAQIKQCAKDHPAYGLGIELD
jgi:superfamily II DNA/RNA helicase